MVGVCGWYVPSTVFCNNINKKSFTTRYRIIYYTLRRRYSVNRFEQNGRKKSNGYSQAIQHIYHAWLCILYSVHSLCTYENAVYLKFSVRIITYETASNPSIPLNNSGPGVIYLGTGLTIWIYSWLLCAHIWPYTHDVCRVWGIIFLFFFSSNGNFKHLQIGFRVWQQKPNAIYAITHIQMLGWIWFEMNALAIKCRLQSSLYSLIRFIGNTIICCCVSNGTYNHIALGIEYALKSSIHRYYYYRWFDGFIS